MPTLSITCSQPLGLLTFLCQRQAMRGADCWFGQVQGWISFSPLLPDAAVVLAPPHFLQRLPPGLVWEDS